jgi:hypothetical protein
MRALRHLNGRTPSAVPAEARQSDAVIERLTAAQLRSPVPDAFAA